MHDDWLERALAAGETAVPDDGFTLRVMQALPPVARPRLFGRSDLILLGGVAAGSALTAAMFPVAPFLNLLIQSAHVTWLGGVLMLACMAGALLYEPLRNSL
jgi:hypothetical protein